ATVSDLREELELIYIYTRDFIKERTDDLKAFKDTFKELVYSASEKMNLRNKNSQFKREFEKEFIDKPKITLKELKQNAEMTKENEGMKERENNLNRKRSRRSGLSLELKEKKDLFFRSFFSCFFLS